MAKRIGVPEVDRSKAKERDRQEDIKVAMEVDAQLKQAEAELNQAVADDIGKMQERDPARRLTNTAPSFMPPDFTEIPDMVDFNDGTRRPVKDPNRHYRWVRFQGRNPRVADRRLRGWRPVLYADTFEGSGLYEKTVNGYVANGDCILMWISMDGYEKIKRDIAAIKALRSGAVDDNFHSEMDKIGLESFEEDEDGKRTYA